MTELCVCVCVYVCACAGVKGCVLGSSGPLQGALVVVSDRLDRCPFTTDHNGEYYRLLLPGNYTFMVHMQ